jgi:predicted glycoside hydrolase/deacetylase ChbG (UPF0249 family)
MPAFRATLGHFVRDLALGRIDPRHIEREAMAQVRHLQTGGLTLTHIDTHKHTHIFPRVLAPVLRAAQECGVRCVRAPFEPEWSVRATPRAGVLRRMEVRLLRRLRKHFLLQVRAAGMATTDGCLGIAATGTLDAGTVRAILDQMPEGTWELLCHPAYVDAGLRAAHTRLVESREEELRALLATLARGANGSASSAIDAAPAAVRRVHFGDLPLSGAR